MAAEQVTPTELGIPLPLVPIDDLEYARQATNWHHHFHPRNDPLLTEGGFVIRMARLQRAFTYGNHTEYHQYFTGPDLPSTNEDRLRVTVLARAGYIPEHGILTRRNLPPTIVTLNKRQRWLLSSEAQMRGGSIGETREFLGKFILAQDLSDIKEPVIDEFLTSRDYERKRVIGNWLLSQAIHRACLPIAKDYRQARSTNRISHSLPTKPQRFVRNVLGHSGQRSRLVQQLETKLVA